MRARGWYRASAFMVSAAFVLAGTYHFLPHARLSPVEDRFDFGDVSPNQDLFHTFTLNRSGFGPLKMVRVSSSCACLNADLRDGPGGWFIDMRMRAEQKLGEKSVYAWVETDEPVNRRHQLQLTCRVISPVNISPLPLDFGAVEADHAAAAVLGLDVSGAEGIGEPRVTIIDRVDPSVVRSEHSGRDSKYRLSFVAPAPIGPLTATMRVSFPSGGPAPQEFPIRGMIVGDTYASPYEIESVWQDVDRPFSTRAELIAAKPGPGQRFEIERLFGDLADSSDLDISLTDQTKGTFLEVRLRPGKRWARGAKCQGVARIRCGDGTMIHIPVAIHIARFGPARNTDVIRADELDRMS